MSPAGATTARLAAAAGAALLLGACAYDYAQRTDRVGFSAGNAVHANLEGQTVNPSDGARYKTGGLGRNGVLVETEATAQSGSPTP